MRSTCLENFLGACKVKNLLNKLFQIDPKLTFDKLHILNHGRISEIEKIFDGPDLQPESSDL